jgi:hypothetical protein
VQEAEWYVELVAAARAFDLEDVDLPALRAEEWDTLQVFAKPGELPAGVTWQKFPNAAHVVLKSKKRRGVRIPAGRSP